MAGRKPIPTSAKIVKGTFRKDRANRDEPQFDPNIPTPPEHLGRVALVEWGRVAESLYRRGLLADEYRAGLAAYCQAYERWVAAETLLKEQGMLTETTNGNVIQNPAVGIANTALLMMHRFMTEFGLTPASKSRVSAKSEKQEETNPFARLAGK